MLFMYTRGHLALVIYTRAHLALVKYTRVHLALVIYTRAHLALVKYTCPSPKAPPVFDWYQFLLLGGRGMCVINFPKIIT